MGKQMISRKKKAKQLFAAAMAAAMAGGMIPNGTVPANVQVKAETVGITEDFNKYENVSQRIGSQFGSPAFALSENGAGGSKALQVGDRKENYFGYSYDVTKFRGNTVKVSAAMAAYEALEAQENQLSATIKITKSGADDDYQYVAGGTATGSQFITIDGTYEIPKDCDKAEIYFEAPKDVNYLIDDVSITVEGEYVDPTVKPAYVDVTQYEILKDLYKTYFKMGVASEAISNWNNQLSEIGNPAKEALIKQEFNSLTFGNELKPDYNMGFKSEEATDTNLPFVINKAAKEMLDWAKDNGIKVRGHVLVWHSQCPDAIFCKDYNPVYKDANKKVLDPSCYESKEVMLKRLESYIHNTIKYMYENGYGDVIYAWDVVNEAVEPGTNQYDLRNSYWYQTMGTDFMYYSFRYAREAVDKYAKEYASVYHVDPEDENGVAGIKPKLFYNDYNEFQANKRDAIIRILTEDINGHNIKKEGYIDGVGMQSHVTDTTNINDFITAMRMYSEAVGEVHITELDVGQTSAGVNADYYQALFFNNFFKALVKAREEGVNLTSVTIWGLTDDNSWKKESSPLIFRSDLSKKLAFDGIVNAVTGKEMPEPEYVAPDFSDINMNFEGEDVEGFTARGDGKLAVQHEIVYKGNGALADTGRTSTWNGASFDVSRFVGQRIAVSAWVKSDAEQVKLSADIDGKWPNIASATSNGKWVRIKGEYKVPSDLTALKLYFEASDLSDIYIDQVKVKLVGLEEGFEEDTHIAKARGVGHMPFVAVTDTVKRSGSKSLKVMRDAQEATMSFDVSKYVGQTVNVKAYVKTEDSEIRLGLDGDTPVEIARVKAVKGGWTEITGRIAISNKATSANMYIETDGSADFYVDDICVGIADYVDDVEGEGLNFTTRWGGAGTISKVEDGKGNHAVLLTNREETYYGTCFDVSAYLGMEVEISLDVKTDDATISLSGDINNEWPNYAKVASEPGKYKTVRTIVNLPKGDLTALKLYVETDGNSDLYVDNLKIRRVGIDEEQEAKPSTPASPEPSIEPSRKPVHEVNVNISKVKDVIVKAVELKKHLSQGEDVILHVIDRNGKELCTWTFASDNYSASVKMKDIKLGVTTGSAKSAGYSGGMLVAMEHKNKLPMEAKVKVKAEKRFKAGTKLYLYRKDKKSKKLYCLPSCNYKVDANGYVVLNVAAGADYVLLPAVAKDSEKVSVLAQVVAAKDVILKKGSTKSVVPVLPDTLVPMNSFKNFKAAEHKAVYGATITYKTSKKSVATVSKDGKVTAKGKGKATITATVKTSNGWSRNYKTTITVK